MKPMEGLEVQLQSRQEKHYKPANHFDFGGNVGMRCGDASIILVAIVLASIFAVTITILPGNVEAATLFVGGSGPGNYTAIQSAIDNATPGDTIHVYSGTYYENVRVYKYLSLIGEDRNTTIVDGNGLYDVVKVTADWVNISSFTIRNSGTDWMDGGISLEYAQNCSIRNNTLLENEIGVVSRFSNNTSFLDNNVSGRDYYGIYLASSNNNVIVNNIISSESQSYSIYVAGSHNATVINNTISGRDLGIFLSGSESSRILMNVMIDNGIYVGGRIEHWNTHTIDSSNTVNGKPVIYWKNANGGTIPPGAGEVILANCTNVVVENLNLSEGSIGILFGFSSDSTIRNNTITSQTWASFELWNCYNSTVTENNISRNGIIQVSESNNTEFADNELFSNSGFFIFDSTNITISNNSISQGGAINVYDHGGNATILNNTISYCFASGISLYGLANTTV
ncbi:MAG: right-handed parallel beta-helix repeat-containing protein, partial [Thermoplasmata archaeon]|nr:right-handed parallel beta-helix repeat-containing protein [Thermoplasmata archaeon]